MQAAILERVSTEEQVNGYGLETQDDACRAYVGGKDWSLVDVYADEGVSGSLTSRPQFDRLMEDARAGRIDVVVVHKFDRVGRTGRSFWRWIWELEDLEIAIVSVTQEIDTTTTHGKLMLQQYAAFAELEYNLIRERTQAGIQRKAAAGGFPGGSSPYGWRIEGKGKRGSFLVVDDHESATLRRAWDLVVGDALNTRQAASRLNAEGLVTRSGKPWSHANLRNKLVSDSTLKNRMVFRNPNRSKAGHGAKFKKDGTSVHGETVTIDLPPIFTADEATDLARALGRTSSGVKPKAAAYPVSRRLFGQCGSHFVGLRRSGRAGRWYRCTGKTPPYPGAPVCTCPVVDADAVEGAVWSEVVSLLGNPEQLKEMARSWVGMNANSQTDHAARIADLDQQIKEREDALTTTVTDYAKAGLPAAAVAAATRALTEELESLQDMRREAAAWLEETEAAEQRARDLEALAIVARERLVDMDPAEQAEVLALLDVKVTITGPVPKPRLGVACSLAQWFKDHDRQVPAELTDEAWARVEPIVKATESPNHRMMPGRLVLDAIFFKARTGTLWHSLPERFGNGGSVHTRYKRWVKAGVWDEIMSALPPTAADGPVWQASVVPPLRVEGRVDPRMMAPDPERCGDEQVRRDEYGRVTALAPIRFRLAVAA